jgi:hypothetical protein
MTPLRSVTAIVTITILVTAAFALVHARRNSTRVAPRLSDGIDKRGARKLRDADSVGTGPPETCAVWLDNVDRETFRRHARQIAGKNIHPYRTGKDIVDWLQTRRNVQAFYIYGHGSVNGLDAPAYRVVPSRDPKRPTARLVGLYRASLDHTPGSMDARDVWFELDRPGGERNFSDLADAVVSARFRRSATVFFACCDGRNAAHMLSTELKERQRGDIHVVGANDLSNGSGERFEARPGRYLYYRDGAPELVRGQQRSVRTLP